MYVYGKGKLKEKVFFLGECNNVEDYFKIADIFILNSNKEGMPNVLLEAMASGIAVIVRSLKGVDGFISQDKKNSLVINNSKELKAAINKLMNEDKFAHKIGNEAREFISSKFSLVKVASGIIDKFN